MPHCHDLGEPMPLYKRAELSEFGNRISGESITSLRKTQSQRNVVNIVASPILGSRLGSDDPTPINRGHLDNVGWTQETTEKYVDLSTG